MASPLAQALAFQNSVNPAQSGVAPTDVVGAYKLATDAAEKNYAAKLAQQQAMWGGLAGLGGAGILAFGPSAAKNWFGQGVGTVTPTGVGELATETAPAAASSIDVSAPLAASGLPVGYDAAAAAVPTIATDLGATGAADLGGSVAADLGATAAADAGGAALADFSIADLLPFLLALA